MGCLRAIPQTITAASTAASMNPVYWHCLNRPTDGEPGLLLHKSAASKGTRLVLQCDGEGPESLGVKTASKRDGIGRWLRRGLVNMAIVRDAIDTRRHDGGQSRLAGDESQ